MQGNERRGAAFSVYFPDSADLDLVREAAARSGTSVADITSAAATERAREMLGRPAVQTCPLCKQQVAAVGKATGRKGKATKRKAA